MRVPNDRNFLIFWIGEGLSLLGDHFYFIALPLFALQLTQDPFIVGVIFALASIPRAIFVLFGGVRTANLSPRSVMIAANGIRFALIAALSVLIFRDSAETWMLYAVVVAMGLMDAFYIPAQAKIVAQVVHADLLQTALTAITETMFFAAAIGPVLAGILIGSYETTIGVSGPSRSIVRIINTDGIGVALAFNALTFAVTLITLFLLKPPAIERANFGATRSDVRGFAGFKAVFDEVRGNASLRIIFGLVVFASFAASGPFFVGIPLMAALRFDDVPMGFGILMGAFGLGMLLGTLLASRRPNFVPGSQGWQLLTLMAAQGMMFILLSLADAMIAAAVVVLIGSIALGFLLVAGISWLQQSAPPEQRGRVTSLYYLAIALLFPLSALIAGFLVDSSLDTLFIVAGILLILPVALPFLPFFGDMPAQQELDAERLRDTRRRIPHEEMKGLR
jgi:MFS family permease